MGLIVILYSLFASVFTIAKVGLDYTQPIFFVGSRMVIAGILMIAYQALTAPQTLVIKKKFIWTLVGLAFFNIYLTNVMEFWGLKYLTSFKTCFIYSLSPFMAAFLSYFMFDERMTSRKWLGLGIGIVGFAPILVQMGDAEATMVYGGVFSLPEIAVMVAAAASSFGWILMRKLIKEGGYQPLVANGFSMLIGGVFSLVHSGLVETWDPMPVTSYVPFLECTLLLVIISNILAYNLYGVLLRRFTATFLSFSGFITPLITAFFGWVVLGETITTTFFVSASVVFVGLLVFYQEELRLGVRVGQPAAIPVNDRVEASG